MDLSPLGIIVPKNIGQLSEDHNPKSPANQLGTILSQLIQSKSVDDLQRQIISQIIAVNPSANVSATWKPWYSIDYASEAAITILRSSLFKPKSMVASTSLTTSRSTTSQPSILNSQLTHDLQSTATIILPSSPDDMSSSHLPSISTTDESALQTATLTPTQSLSATLPHPHLSATTPTLSSSPTTTIETINSFYLTSLYNQYNFWMILFGSGLTQYVWPKHQNSLDFSHLSKVTDTYAMSLLLLTAALLAMGWDHKLDPTIEIPTLEMCFNKFQHNVQQLLSIYFPFLHIPPKSRALSAVSACKTAQLVLPKPQIFPQIILNMLLGYSYQLPPLLPRKQLRGTPETIPQYISLTATSNTLKGQRLLSYEQFLCLWLEYSPELYLDIVAIQKRLLPSNIPDSNDNNQQDVSCNNTNTNEQFISTSKLESKIKFLYISKTQQATWPHQYDPYNLIHESFIEAWLSINRFFTTPSQQSLRKSNTKRTDLTSLEDYVLNYYSRLSYFKNLYKKENPDCTFEPLWPTFGQIFASFEYVQRILPKEVNRVYMGSNEKQDLTMSWPQFLLTMFVNPNIDDFVTVLQGFKFEHSNHIDPLYNYDEYDIIEQNELTTTIQLIPPSTKWYYYDNQQLRDYTAEYIWGDKQRTYTIKFPPTTRQIETFLLSVLQHAPSHHLITLLNSCQPDTIEQIKKLQYNIKQRYNTNTTISTLTFFDFFTIAGTTGYAPELIRHFEQLIQQRV